MRFGAPAALLLLVASPAAPLTLDIPGSADGSFMTTAEVASADDCGGRNISPAIAWHGVPPAARSLALTVFDPDAGGGAGYVHWVLYDLPPTLAGLPAGAGRHLPAGSTGGVNSPGNRFYFGACPPVGDPPHHYIFHLYALDLPLHRLPRGLSEPLLRAAIAGHVLAQARITLLYQRS